MARISSAKRPYMTIKMLRKNTISKLSWLMILLVGCAPLEPLEPLVTDAEINQSAVAFEPANMVCNHQFTPAQLASRPNFIETENNAIITGNTTRELFTSLASVTPNRGIGATVWNLKWQFDSRSSSRGCKIADVGTQVAITYELPLWPERVAATNRQIVDQWNQYSDALRVHHCLHGKTGIDASIEVKESLRRMAPRNSCDQLKADADELARSIVGKYKAVESQFSPPAMNDFFFK